MTDTPSGLPPELIADMVDGLDVELSQAQLDQLVAVVDLAGRAGAESIYIGETDEGIWEVTAQYRGAHPIAAESSEIGEAADTLARRLLTGAACTGCHKPVTLSDVETLQKKGCRWYRNSARWARGCDTPPGPKCPSCGAVGSFSILQPTCSRCGVRAFRRNRGKPEFNQEPNDHA